MQTSNLTVETRRLLGTPLAVTDYERAASLTQVWAREPGVRAVAAANTHMVAMARHDPAFAATLSRFDLIVPDGMPLIWAMNRRGAGMLDRVYGPTLMLHVLARPGLRHFFLGGSEALLQSLVERLGERFPALEVAGTYAPPFGVWSAEENARIIEKIAASGARVIWIGLGCPKQERWIADHKAELPKGVYFAIGAAFAFHAGKVSQAPAWMQKRGLEWLYRLAVEPRRLWKRYVVYNTLFLWYLFLESLTGASQKP